MPTDPFEGAGSLREAYARANWAATALGPVASWGPALRHAVDVALHSRFPVALLWGPDHVLVYNEAFVELIADKHPTALGAPARDVFPEAWDTIGPMLHDVLAGGEATWMEDLPLPLRRRGRLEESYFTFSYSPVRAEDGTIEGVLDVAAETTQRSSTGAGWSCSAVLRTGSPTPGAPTRYVSGRCCSAKPPRTCPRWTSAWTVRSATTATGPRPGPRGGAAHGGSRACRREPGRGGAGEHARCLLLPRPAVALQLCQRRG